MKSTNFSPARILSLSLFLYALTIRAQLVADGTTATISGINTNVAGNVTVGNTGSFTTLNITSGGTVTNSGNGIIGSAATSRTNLVTVTGNNSVWNNSGTLAIGSLGAWNQLVISNGGTVFNTFGNIGFNASGTNSTVIVTDPNSTWYCSQRVNVGNTAPNCRLFVLNGGRVWDLDGAIGNGSGANVAVVAGTGSVWTNRTALNIGTITHFNELWVTNGGTIRSDGIYIGGDSTQAGTGNSNSVTVSGINSCVTNSGPFQVGAHSSYNRLTISGGAKVRNSSEDHFTIGVQPASGNNSILVTGTNSLLSNRSTGLGHPFITVGQSGSGSQLQVRDGALAEGNTGGVGVGPGSNNVAIVADPGSKWFSSEVLYVGFSGKGSQLIITNGGVVENNLGRIGQSLESSNNLVTVSGAGSLWSNTAALYVGNQGSANQLTIGSGGTVTTTNLVVGFDAASSNNIATIAGGNLFVTNAGKGVVEARGGDLRLTGGNLITDFLLSTNSGLGFTNSTFLFNHGNLTTLQGASIVQSNTFEMGRTFGQTATWNMPNGTNTIVVTPPFESIQLGANGQAAVNVSGSSTLWSNSGPLYVGYVSSGNRLFVTNGGRVISLYGFIGLSLGTADNQVWISDPGSRWTCLNDLTVGNFGVNNRVVVTNGGWLVNNSTFIGSGNIAPSNNTVVVTGAGSKWENQNTLYLGWGSSSNSVLVASNGLLTANQLVIGMFNFVSNNVLTVSGGLVMVTNGTTNAALRTGQDGQGALNLNSGTVQADLLLVTNGTKSILNFGGGTLRTAQTIYNNGSPCLAGNGVSAATLELLGGTHSFASGLTINDNAQLKGVGAIVGNVTLEGLLSPGTSIGRLTITGALSCVSGSTNFFEINKSTATNDTIIASGTVAYAGTLVVTNLAGSLTNGDSFKLFTAGSYSGSFTTLQLPPLPSGLGWINTLASDGRITAGAAPRDLGVDVSHFQGESGISVASWNQMFTQGKRFAFVKATEGLSVLDATMPNNINRATAAGLRAGVYHFAHPELRPTPSGAVQEADYLLAYAGNFIGPGYLRPVLDLETGSGLSTAALTDWVIAFSNEIITNRGVGAAPIIYCSQFYAVNELDSRLANYDLWLRVISGLDPLTAQPPNNGNPTATGVFTNWAFWQYADTGSSGGISPLDLDVCHSEYKLLDSFLIPAVTNPAPPLITLQPLSRTVTESNNATFSVTVSVASSTPLAYQWRFYQTNIIGATQSTFTRIDAVHADAGPYTVVITNSAGSVTSSVATLTVANPEPAVPPIVLYQEDFDGFTNSVVTSPTTTNGFKILYSSVAVGYDFSARFGFDYSTVSFPTNIPSAPHTTGGTKRGLYLTVNKDGVPGASAVNLYPVSQVFTGNFSLKFDMWINYPNSGAATEHTLFGINHSGNVTNRVSALGSDGLFFAVDGDGGVSAGSATLRDFSVFIGGGTNIPAIKTSFFGPEPLLGANFDQADAGFAGMFQPKPVTGFVTGAGTAGLEWISVEVRQETNLITWLFNDAVVAQYANPSGYTNGNIMLGYNDAFNSVSTSDNFVIFDNLRVETPNPLSPIQLSTLNVNFSGSFGFSFTNMPGTTFTVLASTNIALPISNWTILGPVTETSPGHYGFSDPQATNNTRRYYRVRWP